LQYKKTPYLIALFVLLALQGTAQERDEEKVKKLPFCGYKYIDSSKIRTHFRLQLQFLNIKDGDTVIDVGSSSGAYIGALNVIAPFSNVHFILVDIDSNCLNTGKMNNMLAHYQKLHGAAFTNSFNMVNNTPDSLCLPLLRYKKLLLFNTLHEIPDKAAMVKQITAILQSGGEAIIAEILPTQKRSIHMGCNLPLLSADAIIKLFSDAGFTFKASQNLQTNPKRVNKTPYYFFRFIKN
jgi:ubiquinone/menaquinone biosynthesis C-methylase UbiE